MDDMTSDSDNERIDELTADDTSSFYKFLKIDKITIVSCVVVNGFSFMPDELKIIQWAAKSLNMMKVDPRSSISYYLFWH